MIERDLRQIIGIELDPDGAAGLVFGARGVRNGALRLGTEGGPIGGLHLHTDLHHRGRVAHPHAHVGYGEDGRLGRHTHRAHGVVHLLGGEQRLLHLRHLIRARHTTADHRRDGDLLLIVRIDLDFQQLAGLIL